MAEMGQKFAYGSSAEMHAIDVKAEISATNPFCQHPATPVSQNQGSFSGSDAALAGNQHFGGVNLGDRLKSMEITPSSA